jgi:hypothetical protein
VLRSGGSKSPSPRIAKYWPKTVIRLVTCNHAAISARNWSAGLPHRFLKPVSVAR